ncbi:MAG: putative manganese-dependent inorganic diphosphatase [Candidatus Faecimonas sp.]|nr:putative manganese-dependent inorganic diphosphatase [Mycoplasmatota bacterium]MDY2907897.1 putative manganese-dependent inorganic diphosphatase [Candidatus Faecimonas sp.]
MEKTFIFGHKKPDSDSVMSAIGLSYLKNKLGDNTEARILGNVNKETKYALEYFGLKEPEYLNDVKLQIKDVNYHKGFFIKDTGSIYDGYQEMLKEGLTGIPVVQQKNSFLGLITIKDLSHMVVNANFEELFTSYDNIMKVLKGEEILKFDDEIIGKIMVAAYRSTTFINQVPLSSSDVLIVGDRHSVIEYAVESGVKLVILSGDSEIKEKHIEIARKNKVNIIRTPYDSYHITRLLPLTNYIKTMIRSYNPTKFEESEYVDTVLDINNKLKHTNYPVVDRKNRCLGLLKIIDLNEKHPKNVILVDHNEKLQSVEGIDEANILEIFDHHNLGSITTSAPINFRNMAVGSTCTIVYTLYKERGVEIPKEIAGALLSGILSDTLILKSPTATPRDRQAVEELSNIADVDYQEYGMNMLKAGTSLEGMTKEDVLYNDFKLYTVNEKTFAIGQFFTMNFDEMKKELDEYIHTLDEVAEANNYDFVALYVTDIIQNGSYVIFNTKGQNVVDVVYDKENLPEGYFVDNCVSRKKHVVPLIMEVFEN